MKMVQVLGSGCPNCEKMAAMAKKAAEELNLEFHLEKVTDVNRIMGFGVLVTPALVVDGEVKVSGRVPSYDEIKGMLA